MMYIIHPQFHQGLPHDVTGLPLGGGDIEDMAFIGLMCALQTPLIIAGGLDLSVAAVAGLSGVVVALLLSRRAVEVAQSSRPVIGPRQ